MAVPLFFVSHCFSLQWLYFRNRIYRGHK